MQRFSVEMGFGNKLLVVNIVQMTVQVPVERNGMVIVSLNAMFEMRKLGEIGEMFWQEVNVFVSFSTIRRLPLK